MGSFQQKWTPRSTWRLAFRLFCFVSFTGLLNAKPPEELINLVNLYERQKRALEITAIIDNIRELEKLEITLEKADYSEDAKLVRNVIDQRQRRMHSLLRIAAQAPLPKGKKPKGKRPIIYLTPPQAKLSGSLKGSFRQIINWITTDCTANWPLTGLIPGRYLIQINYIPVIGGGGEIQVRELDQLIRKQIPAASPDKRFKRSIRIGTIKLRQSVNLEVTPNRTNGRGVFLLTGVQLILVE